MELPARSASFRPVVKCSNCGNDIGLDAVADHKCPTMSSGNDMPALSSIPPNTLPPLLPRTDSSNSLKSLRPQRPLLPKIDAAVAFRPPAFAGELTPASSGHSSMISPVSASSGSRSPFPALRKGSIPGPRRPPSPELSNLDCAFPPFPMASKQASSKRRERAATQRDDSKRSRSRDKARPRQANRPPPLARAATTDNFAQSQSDRPTGDKFSRPSTAASSRKESVSTNGENPKASVEEATSDHADTLHTNMSSQPPNVINGTAGRSLTPPISRTNTEPDLSPHTRVDPGLQAFHFGELPSEAPSEESDPIMNINRINTAPVTNGEPSYKSKRPPPILNDHQAAQLPPVKTPTTTQPGSAGVFSKGLGRLFGRRRSQSATSRREVVRQALSDEPDDYDSQSINRSILSPDSEKSFLTAEPSPIGPSPLRSPVAASSVEEALKQLSGHGESLQALEGLAPTPAETPVVVVEPIAEDSISTSVSASSAEVVEPVVSPAILETTTERSLLEIIDLQRASIDSASSYGSIGFSEHSSSSRSSSPQGDALTSHTFEMSYSSLLKQTDADFPAPLRPRLPEASSNLTTDPFARKGRSSAIVDVDNSSNDSVGAPTAISSDQDEPSAPASDPEPLLKTKSKGTMPNKGVCRGCSKIILVTQKSVSSADGRLTGRYHKECFVCWTCKAAFPTAEFYVHSDHPYCAHHYHELEDTLCATCGKGIEGLYMETHNVAGRGKEKHHPECLKCTTCKVRLDHDYFELSGKVYCERDAFRLATMPKAHDNAPTRPSPLIREYISSGDPGLIKGRNFPERRITRLMNTT